ncbi:coiled-coil domain-containing protein 62-like [Xenia sp. Carnegie-2017]|uniref:coiled-coil domain-containing protein 62-like n=1 Tax=Xenia sp. Carnegie-2017 TaxID=2897299 RepID=UPI001F0402F0|nr:coiled-coil domain-containing protein 62-like [Xenia sp. Carnegie-2017]
MDNSFSDMNMTFQPTTVYQSTPKAKQHQPSLSTTGSVMNSSLMRSPPVSRSPSSVHRQSQSKSPVRLYHGRSLSPRKLLDVDADTIQKQRRELQLLIAELKDRDRELNDMVCTHQKHLQSWQEDRQRIVSFEKRCTRLEGELKSRNEQCKALNARLKNTEAQELRKRNELETTLARLKEVTEQAEIATHQLVDLEESNVNLGNSLREVSNNFGKLQAREQELVTKIKLKENDITEASITLGEFQKKTKQLETILQEYETVEKALRTECDQLRDQVKAGKNEVENLRGEMTKQFSDADDLQTELAQSKQEVLVLQKEVFLAGEREKRKDQLIELQKSKQERTDSELKHLRQICERQQRDLTYGQIKIQESHHNDEDKKIKDLFYILGLIFPTSKLHRLLAESRQMVQNLEQTTVNITNKNFRNGLEGFSPLSTSPSSNIGNHLKNEEDRER